MANYKLHGRIDFQGINVSVENRAGSVRRGTDPDGHEWQTKMDGVHYGRIIGIPRKGADSEHVDVFVKAGPQDDVDRVFVVHLMKTDDSSKFDEDKCFLNFRCQKEVRRCFNKHYDEMSQKLWGGCTEMSLENFKQRLRAQGKGMIKSSVLHVIDLAKGYVEGYIRHDKSGQMIPVKAYENSKVGASASCLTENSELCQGFSMGKLMARIEMDKSCRNDLRNVLSHLTGEYGDKGVSVFEDWVNPAKIGARLFSKALQSGMQTKEAHSILLPVLQRYEKDFQEVLAEEGFRRSLSGCTVKTFHVMDMDLIKAHVKAHFRKDPKTGKYVFVADYENSVQAHPDHEHITFEKGEKVETKNGNGTIMGYDEKKHVLRIKLDNGKYASVTPHLVKHLDKKKEDPDQNLVPIKEETAKTFDEKVKDAGVDVEGILWNKEPEKPAEKDVGGEYLIKTAEAFGLETNSAMTKKWEGWIKGIQHKPVATEQYFVSQASPGMPENHLQAYAEALYLTGHKEALKSVYSILKQKAEEKLGHPLEGPKPEPPKKSAEPPKKARPKKEPEKSAEAEPKAMTDDDIYKKALAEFDPDKSISIPSPKTKENPDGIGMLNIKMASDITSNPKTAHFGMQAKDGSDFPITNYENIKKFNKIGPSGGGNPNDELSYQDQKIQKYVDMVKGKPDDEVKTLIDGMNDSFELFHVYKALQNSKLDVLNFPMAWHALIKLDHLAKIKMAAYMEEEKKQNAQLYEALKEVKSQDVFNKLNHTGKTRGHLNQMGQSAAVDLIKKDLEQAGFEGNSAVAEKIYSAIRKFTDGEFGSQRHAYYMKHSGWSPYGGHSFSENHVKEMELAEEYLNIAPPFPDPDVTTLYRGMHGARKAFDKMNVGDEYQLGAPTSITNQKSTALSFNGDTMFIIHGGLPKGSSVRFISPFSEGEVMGSASTKFKIIKKENDPLNPGRLLVHMAVVDNKPLHEFKHLKKKGT